MKFPYQRNRVHPNRKKRKKILWSMIKVIFVLAMIAGTGVGGKAFWNWLQGLSYFRIQKIEVAGLNHLSEEAIMPYLEKSRDQSLLRINLEEYRNLLEKNPWIQTVHLKRDFPDRLEVKVIEKKPLGYIRDGGGLCLLDEEGRYISKELGGFKDLPELKGVHVEKWIQGDEREIKLVQKGVAFIQSAMKPNFLFAREELTSIHLRSEDDLEARIGGASFLFRYPYPAQQWLRFLSVKNDILNRNMVIENIDLRYSGKVIVRPMKEKA